ncbi:MAG: AAA family ATPase [Dehalococcoidia bacterium]|nr:AAA family ATPase [Dehalococcoidia bacterium]
MVIQKLIIKNFRSMDEEGITLEFSEHTNVIVGENNAGKSAILAAVDMLKQLLHFDPNNPPTRRGYRFQEFDWHRGNKDFPIEVKAFIKLSSSEVASLLEIFKRGTRLPDIPDEVLERIKEELCQSLEIGTSWTPETNAEEAYYLKCGFLYIDGNDGNTRFGHLPVKAPLNWEDLLQEWQKASLQAFSDKMHLEGHTFKSDADLEGAYKAKPEGLSTVTLQEVMSERLSERENHVVEFHFPIGGETLERHIGDFIAPKLKSFADIRLRPEVGRSSYALESPDGREMASVLFNLKMNTDINLRAKYDRIREDFHELFPDLAFDSIEGPDIVFMNWAAPGYQIPVQAIGTGIVETLIFMTNLMGTEDNILLIDTPELHLHPHAQRLLGELFKKYETNNQLFVVTHSPYFIESDNIGAHIRVALVNGKTQTEALPQKYLTQAELSKVGQILLEPGHREMLFARKVLLVEGPTELGAIPVFASRLERPLDRVGVSVISVGGKKDFYMFMKLLRGFSIPFLVLTDRDALMQITDHLEIAPQSIPTSSMFGQLARLGVLSAEERGLIQQLASSSSIVPRKNAKGDTTHWYAEKDFNQLKDIANAHGCLVLPGTFEQVITEAGFDNLLAEAEQEVGSSKVRQGRYTALKIPQDQIPEPFIQVIKALTKT